MKKPAQWCFEPTQIRAKTRFSTASVHDRLLTTPLLLACILLCAGCPKNDEAEEGPAAELDPCQNLEQLQLRLGSRISSTAPGAGSFAAYTISVGSGSVSATIPNPCGDAIASRLEESACGFCNSYSSRCEGLVKGIFESPPSECSTCGDGICTNSEDRALCPEDCSINCGDGLCEADFGETEELCAIDCAGACGDGVCAGNETNTSCATDCNYTSGDGLCGFGENPLNSPSDCTGESCSGDGVCANTTCGDNFCQSYEDAQRSCPEDCCTRVCDRDTALGCQANTVVQCALEGLGGCPEVTMVETCEFGCESGRCLTCPRFANIEYCDEPDAPTCDETTGEMRYCQPLPGLPTCLQRVRVPCPEGCNAQGCTGVCGPSCEPGQRQCLDGVRLQSCDITEGSVCPTWQTLEICSDRLRCDRNPPDYRCVDESMIPDTAPVLTSFTPNTGAPGDTIVFEGRNFGEAGRALFAPAQNAEIVLWSDTRIEARVPEDAENGAVVLETPNGPIATPGNFNITPNFDAVSTCGARGYPMYVYAQGLAFDLDIDFRFSPGVVGRILSRLSSYYAIEVPLGAESGPLLLETPGGSATLLPHFEVIEPEAWVVPVRPHWPIPDSEGAACINAEEIIPCPAPGEPFYGQDGNYAINPPSYTLVGDGAIRDEVTGLMWQRSVDAAPQLWTQARCTCQELELEGFDDWRMPTLSELLSIMNMAQTETGTTLAPEFNTPEFVEGFWTSVENLREDARTTTVSVSDYGRLFTQSFAGLENVRCVRADAAIPDQERYLIEETVVTDQFTQLMWLRNVDPAGGSTWEQALANCEALEFAGFDDWRLPSSKELLSLMDARIPPHVDALAFPTLIAAWSSTPVGQPPSRAVALNFTGVDRSVTALDVTSNRLSHCVRQNIP